MYFNKTTKAFMCVKFSRRLYVLTPCCWIDSVGGGHYISWFFWPWGRGQSLLGGGTLQFFKFCRLLDIFKGSYLLNYWTSIPHLFTKILTLMYSSNMLGGVSLKNFGFEHSVNQIGGGDTTDFWHIALGGHYLGWGHYSAAPSMGLNF